MIQPNGLDGIPGNQDDEECDDNNSIDTDACTSECKIALCGDGIHAYSLPTNDPAYEQCDPNVPGIATGGHLSIACTDTCILSGSYNSLCNMSVPASHFYNVTGSSTFVDIVNTQNIPLCSPWLGISQVTNMEYIDAEKTRYRTCL